MPEKIITFSMGSVSCVSWLATSPPGSDICLRKAARSSSTDTRDSTWGFPLPETDIVQKQNLIEKYIFNGRTAYNRTTKYILVCIECNI